MTNPVPDILLVAHRHDYAKDLWHRLGASERMMPIGVGGALAGRRFEIIIVANMPISESQVVREREFDWLEQIRCRLSPTGRMVFL